MEENVLLTPRGKYLSTRLLLSLLCLGLTTIIALASLERQTIRELAALACLDIVITGSCIYSYGRAIFITSLSGVMAFCKRYRVKSVALYLIFLLVSYVVLTFMLDKGFAQTTRIFTKTVEEQLGDFIVDPEIPRPVSDKSIRYSEVENNPQSHIRYPGEDVVFLCQRTYYYSTDVIPYADQVIWEQDGKMFTLSDKKSITWSFEDTSMPHEKEKTYLITSRLTLMLLNEQDFGKYTCKIRPSAFRKKLSNNLNIIPEESDSDHELVNIFYLIQLQEQIHTVFVPPGGLIYLTASYVSEAEFDDLSFEYTIGGQPYEYVCGKTPGGSLVIPSLYWQYFQNGGHYWEFMFVQGIDVNAGNFTVVFKWQSVCKHAYAVHEFSFFREFFNRNSGMYELHNFTYPYKIRVVPKVPDFLYQVIGKCVLDAIKLDQCFIANGKDGNCKKEEVLDWTFRYLFIFEELLLMAIVIIIMVALTCLTNVFTFMFIRIRNRILEGFFWPCAGCLANPKTLGMIKEAEKTCIKYDVFISHSENDQTIGNDVTKIIESRGYKGFLPDRDINIGMLLTEATSEAIMSSRKFLVILTKDYIDSGMTNRFEFQLILRKVLTVTSDHKNLLFIRRDESGIPKILETMCTIDWMDGDNTEGKCRRLEHWMEGRVSPTGICDCDQTTIEKWFQMLLNKLNRSFFN